MARACNWFFTEVRKQTRLCRCRYSCHTSRSAGNGIQICRRRSSSRNRRICKVSRQLIFYSRPSEPRLIQLNQV